MFKKCKTCGSNITLKINKFKLVECDECKLVFSQKFFSQEELIQTYDFLYNKKDNSHYNVHTNFEYESLLKGDIPRIGYNRKKIIDKYIIDKTIKILEIGSGVGLIASYFKNKGNYKLFRFRIG